MSNASFDTKYKNLCNDKPTYVYSKNSNDGNFVSGGTPFELKNCELLEFFAFFFVPFLDWRSASFFFFHFIFFTSPHPPKTHYPD